MDETKMPFTEHLEELRRRLIICLIALGGGFGVSYIFSKRIYEFLAKPLTDLLPEQSSMIFTGLTEAFLTYIKVSLLAGLFLASPVILFQIWKFIAPGLYPNEKRYAIPFVFFSTIFFVGGGLFGYYLVFPWGFRFLIGFASDSIRAMPSMREFLSLSAKLVIAFGVIFELPVFSLFLARIGVISAESMARFRKYAILIIFVAAAAITPPDIITQLMMAGPLIVLYELSILVARIFQRRDRKLEG